MNSFMAALNMRPYFFAGRSRRSDSEPESLALGSQGRQDSVSFRVARRTEIESGMESDDLPSGRKKTVRQSMHRESII
jgi:hypothetical protein